MTVIIYLIVAFLMYQIGNKQTRSNHHSDSFVVNKTERQKTKEDLNDEYVSQRLEQIMNHQSQVKFGKASCSLDDVSSSSGSSISEELLSEDENLKELDADSDFRRTMVDEKSIIGTPMAETLYQDPRIKKFIIREVRKLEQMAIE